MKIVCIYIFFFGGGSSQIGLYLEILYLLFRVFS